MSSSALLSADNRLQFAGVRAWASSRHHEDEEDLKKDLEKIPIVIHRSGLGNSRHRIQGAGLVDQGLLVMLFVLSSHICIYRIQTMYEIELLQV